MTRNPLTNEQRIEIYTELQRRVSVGAYLELEHDGSFPEDDGSAESTTLESLHNLEQWARREGLQFVWNTGSKTYSLVKIAYGTEEEAENAWIARQVEEEEDEAKDRTGGDGSGLHQCQYCYNLVNEEHEEFCRLNPNRNREIVP